MNRSFAWVMFSLYIVAVLYITMFAWNYGASLGQMVRVEGITTSFHFEVSIDWCV